MADKKDNKKDEKKSSGKTLEESIIILIGIVLLFTAFDRIRSFFLSANGGSGFSFSYLETITGGQNGWLADTLYFINAGVSIYVMVVTIFSIIVFLAILYVTWLTNQMKNEETLKAKRVAVPVNLPSLQSQKWKMVLSHVNSQNPAEWRLSILEADVMLDDMMRSIGFHGDTLGDRLKNTSKADFKTIDLAWEAHKIRNAIAHEGSDFLLSQRESKRVIGLYETVFKEFSYI